MTGIDPIGATGAVSDPTTSTGGRTAGVDNPGAMLDRDAFLKLLVAQLKYQDPTQPADTSQMLSQTAELTMVDRLNELAASFESSAATQRLSLAGTIVGKDITFVDEEGIQRSARVETAKTDIDGLTFVAGGYSVPFAAIVSVDAPAPVIGLAPPSTVTTATTTAPSTTTTAATTTTATTAPETAGGTAANETATTTSSTAPETAAQPAAAAGTVAAV